MPGCEALEESRLRDGATISTFHTFVMRVLEWFADLYCHKIYGVRAIKGKASRPQGVRSEMGL